MGVDLGMRPFVAEGSWASEGSCGRLLRFRMRSMDAAPVSNCLAVRHGLAYRLVYRGASGRRTWWVYEAALQPRQYSAHRRVFSPVGELFPLPSPATLCSLSHAIMDCPHSHKLSFLDARATPALFAERCRRRRFRPPACRFLCSPSPHRHSHLLLLTITTPGSSDPSNPINNPLLPSSAD